MDKPGIRTAVNSSADSTIHRILISGKDEFVAGQTTHCVTKTAPSQAYRGITGGYRQGSIHRRVCVGIDKGLLGQARYIAVTKLTIFIPSPGMDLTVEIQGKRVVIADCDRYHPGKSVHLHRQGTAGPAVVAQFSKTVGAPGPNGAVTFNRQIVPASGSDGDNSG